MVNMIHASALVKRYGDVTALDGPDLDVPRGTVLGLWDRTARERPPPSASSRPCSSPTAGRRRWRGSTSPPTPSASASCGTASTSPTPPTAAAVPDVWSLEHPVAYSRIWIVGILAVFVPLSVARYERAAAA